MTQMQGIVSILRSDNPDKTTKAASLRRTLSADMSSKRWLPTLKKIASSEQIAINSSSSSSSSDESDEDDQCDQVTNPSQMDIWTAIMSQKKQDEDDKIPPPYVHPLVKKSASSLSEKSLKICTESLGSETGSDVFPVSDPNQEKEKEVVKPVSQTVCQTGLWHTGLTTKKAQAQAQAQARAFPPPLPSLAVAHAEGPSLHMQSRRVDGRLVVEAVSVPQQKYFEAQRQDGRFLLTLIKESDHEKNSKSIQKSSVTIKRILDRDNENPSWSPKFKVVEEEATIKQSPQARSRAAGLPPLPPPPTTTTVNSYQYFWRAKPTVASVIDPMITQQQPPTKTKDLVLLRGNKADCFLPSLKCCKEPRRSLLMWEPFCIATS